MCNSSANHEFVKCLPHPTFSPDIAPYDNHVFEAPNEALCGNKFSTEKEMKELAQLAAVGSVRCFFFLRNPGIKKVVADLHGT